MKPLISVLIPAYNHEKYITQTIMSIIDQSYENLELIIIDDGSSDNTWHIIKSLEKRMIMNSLNVLFKRGVYGTYLYAHDPLLRHSLTSLFEKAGFTLLKEEK